MNDSIGRNLFMNDIIISLEACSAPQDSRLYSVVAVPSGFEQNIKIMPSPNAMKE